MPPLGPGSEDECAVPGCTAIDKSKKRNEHKEKLLNTPKERALQRSRSQPNIKFRTRCKEAETITLNPVPNAPGFKAWWNNFCQIVSASSSHPEEAFVWARSVDRDSDFVALNDSEGFHSLDIKLAIALKKIFPGILKNRVQLIEEKWIDRYGTQIKGRQLLVVLFKWFKENEQDADYLTTSHLHGV